MKRTGCLIFIYLLVQKAWAGEPKNVVKINVVPLFLKTFSVQYERGFLRFFSGCVQFGQSGDLSMGVLTNHYLDSRQNATLDKIRSTVTMDKLYTTGSTYFTPELRLYISRKGSPKGFYIAPYLRFSSTNVHAKFTYKDSTSVSKPFTLDGRLKGMFPGVMIGYQKIFFKHISLDFWLGGVQWGKSHADLVAEGDFSTINKDGLREFLEKNVKNGSTNVTITDSKITADYTGNSLGVRLGFCVGIGF